MAANEQFIFTGYFRCSGRRDFGNHSDHVDLHSNTAKKLSENIKNLLVHYMLGDSFLLINRFYFCILILLVFLQSQNFLLICFLDISHMRSVLIYYYLQIK